MPQNAPEPWEYTLHIPHDPRAVTVCRRTLRLILTIHGLIRLTDVAELLATELISNAVRHTKGPAALRLRWRDGVLRIGAWDANPEPPDPAPLLDQASTDSETGRGLTLVQACADVWGWHPLARGTDRGKYVWCDLGAA
ncbi:anti-sigma regulatory factor (Ser/Thr protein kinase) [Streptomyces umbrinus]|jgi:anti-sigma regulatory factor (Ser/Thr protein kinase)|uniref:ATP-binding protein n=1 Tax=Streptomyces umbrinus TaxID=67370 RepID=UPI0016721A05|nr:ATP-binding protein [Streptomyces umbrinus]MCR3727293.1 anti-sigma regulatory factor (Ser/Thr protein kinase) [Streptomyces umbrinus]GHB53730.1 ATPase [Streptomyces umbrinus]GHH56472.1 ATPase [Streptomyces umbrinus]